MSGIALRRHLLVLAVAGVLPLALLAGAGLLSIFEQQRNDAQRKALEITRALATAVESELSRTLSSLHVLASSNALDRGDISSFDALARRNLAVQPEWRAITLADAQGQVLTNTRSGPGDKPPPIVERASFDQVVVTGEARIGSIAKGYAGNYAFAVREPVVRDGKVAYVLSAVVDPTSIVKILQRQRMPDDWTVSVFDANGDRVARSRAHEEFIGGRASRSLRDLMVRQGQEGTGLTTTLEGDSGYTAFTRLPHSGWSVALSLPVAGVTRNALSSTTIYGIAVIVSVFIGLWAATVVARRVNRPMAELREAANALGRGAVPAAPDTDIREIRDVGEAITTAAAQRRAIEAEREDLLRREHEARTDAESANRAKDQFLAMLGHELRNPLAALSNAASLIGDDRVDPQAQRRSREVIQRQVAHLARLTDDLLDAARALLGKIQLRLEPVDLARVAQQTINMIAATRRSANHRIAEDLKEVWVHGDPVRLDQIVANLLTNAVKYTPAGGTIIVRTRREGAQAVLSVIDNGVGLSPELAERAFDLFVQGDRALDRAQGGLGIGLTLVRRLAELHGGAATVRSEGDNRGSEFSVRFPAIEAPVQAPAANVPASARARSVLVVEDNDDAREMLETLLQVMGHRVETARDGIEGLDKALAIAPDIAFVDLGLPGIDGFEVARRLRGAGDQRTFLVALTGYGAREDRDRALAAGFDAHATKPIDANQLAQLLSQRKLGTDPTFHGEPTAREK